MEGMDPNSNSSTGDVETDGGDGSIDSGELYVVVRKAVEDAILGVIGTLLLVGVSIVLIWFGTLVAASAYDSSPVVALAGIFMMLVGIYQAASALGIIPHVTDLL